MIDNIYGFVMSFSYITGLIMFVVIILKESMKHTKDFEHLLIWLLVSIILFLFGVALAYLAPTLGIGWAK